MSIECTFFQLRDRASALLADPQICATDRAAISLALDSLSEASMRLYQTWEGLKDAIRDIEASCACVTEGTARSGAHQFHSPHYSKVTTSARIAAQRGAALALIAAMDAASDRRAAFRALLAASAPTVGNGRAATSVERGEESK